MAYYYEEFDRFAEVAERAELSYVGPALHHLQSWLRENEIPLIKLTRVQAKQYANHLKQMDVIPSYAKACLSIANDFYSWWYGSPNLSPFRGIKIHTARSRSKRKKVSELRILSDYHISRLRNAIGRLHQDPYRFYRAQLVFSMALYMGLSADEMVSLTVEDASTKEGYLLLDDREIPYAPQMKALVRQYLAYRAAKVRGRTPELFVGGEGNPLTPATISKEIQDIATEAKIKVNVKILNDTFAFNLAVDGAPAQVIAKLRGCSHGKAVQFVELALNDEDVAEVYEKSVTQRMRPVKRRVRRVT